MKDWLGGFLFVLAVRIMGDTLERVDLVGGFE